ncbi:MAG: hypothetical protein E6K73_04760 [Candidatus Eisenbacteria bacterium]|uniref:PpiC domain-containing protein n=1 Tax=Eiseniibacteriota bacterium TaxID=2212470 RepID=A0A538SKB0_UNCEI|nr:MAG: hypothetical protein E6K73_04760 [Candidatus Eisenbacteria bacterium]
MTALDRRLALLSALALALAGCSQGSPVLARIGSRTITVAEFTDVARGAGGRYPGSPDSAKAMLLEDLIRRSQMLERAWRSGLLVDSLVRRYRRNVEGEVLAAALVEREVPRDVPVTDAEVAQFYEWRKTSAHVQAIYASDRGMAEQAMRDLERGEDFAAVADHYNQQGMIPRGGDLGFLTPGTLVNPLDGYVRDAPLGRPVGPIEVHGQGWFILRVMERRREAQEPLALQQANLRAMLQQRKQRALAMRVFENLREAYRLEVDPEGPRTLFARFNTPPLIEGMGGESAPPPPSPGERARVLARYDGGEGYRGVYTLGDAVDELDQGADPPPAKMLPAFQIWIESRVLQRLLVLEARRRHLHQEPAIARRIENRVDDYVLDSIYQAEVLTRAETTDDEVRAAYERQSPSLAELGGAHVMHLTVPDSALAEMVIQHARAAPTLRDAILHSSPGIQVHEEDVRYPTTDSLWSGLRPALAATEPGAYVGPLPAGKGWIVIQVISKQQEIPPFEKLTPVLQHNLRAEAAQLAQERLLGRLLDSLRRALPPWVDRAQLKRIPWPVGAEGAPGA